MDPREFVEAVRVLHAAATALAAMTPADLPASLATEAVPALAHAVTLADNALAVVARRVETSGSWADTGARSAAAWLAQVTGGSHGQATARLSAARLVEDHPPFAEAFHAGATSVPHLAAAARVLAGPGRVKAERRRTFPAFAPALAETAAATDSGTFARVLREWCDAVDHHPAAGETDAFRARHLVFTELGDVCLLEGSLPLAEGRLLRRRLEALVDEHHRNPGRSRLRAPDVGPRGDEDLRTPAGDEFTPRSALLLDALLTLADLADAHPDGLPVVDGTPPQVLVVVPAARLTRTGAVVGADQSDADPPPLVPPAVLLTGGDPVPVGNATARWASCGDAELRRLVLDPDGVVTDLGRSSRLASRDLRLAAALRDRYCRYPGCRVPATRCQLHHLVHWADGGHTRLDQLYCCCPTHHRWFHQQEAHGLLQVSGSPDADLDFWSGATHLGTTRPQPLHRLPRRRGA